MRRTILIAICADRERETLETALAAEGHRVLAAEGASEALDQAARHVPDLSLCDRRMPGLDGFDLIGQLARKTPGMPVLLIGEGEEEDLAAEALARGAHDALPWPTPPSRWRLAVRNARVHRDLERSVRLARREAGRLASECPIVAASKTMIELLEQLERVSGLDTPVFLCGEAGSGKELLARAIHAQSPRRNRPLVGYDCASSSEGDSETGLFGRTAVGQSPANPGLLIEANHGTLLLDEVACLSATSQPRLLRALEREEVDSPGESKPHPLDVRIIASSSYDLGEATLGSGFMPELRSRLESCLIHVPPLRERRHDLPLLADHFLAHFCRGRRAPIEGIDDEAMESLLGYGWPGNVRELRHVIERAAILAQRDVLSIEDLPPEVARPEGRIEPLAPGALSLRPARRGFEARLIRRALCATKGNRTHAARLLSISPRALLYKIKEYDLRD